jgi:hypothetical protein
MFLLRSVYLTNNHTITSFLLSSQVIIIIIITILFSLNRTSYSNNQQYHYNVFLIGPRNQINQRTSYLDLSVTYGSTDDGVADLREVGTGMTYFLI